jgi:hypothetical protein
MQRRSGPLQVHADKQVFRHSSTKPDQAVLVPLPLNGAMSSGASVTHPQISGDVRTPLRTDNAAVGTPYGNTGNPKLDRVRDPPHPIWIEREMVYG